MENVSEREIVITRTVDAPREKVFDAWVDPVHIIEWWGPDGFTNTTEHMDVTVGGEWKFMMHGPDGTDYPNLITYKEILRPERLAYSHGSYGQDDLETFDGVVTFEDAGGGKTLVTLRAIFSSAEEREKQAKFGAIEGGNQTLGRFAAYIEKD